MRLVAFPLINARFPHVFCYICPTHSIDNFIKNVFSEKDTVRMRGIERTFTFSWDVDLFSTPIDRVWEVVKFVPLTTKRCWPAIESWLRKCQRSGGPLAGRNSFDIATLASLPRSSWPSGTTTYAFSWRSWSSTKATLLGWRSSRMTPEKRVLARREL